MYLAGFFGSRRSSGMTAISIISGHSRFSFAHDTSTSSPKVRRLWINVSKSARIEDGSVALLPSFSRYQTGSLSF